MSFKTIYYYAVRQGKFFLFLSIIVFTLHSNTLFAQNNYGVSTSNYATIEGGLVNPARLSTGIVKWEVSGLNLHFSQLNNYYTYGSIFEGLSQDNTIDLSSIFTIQRGFISDRSSDLNVPIQYSNATEFRYLNGVYVFPNKSKLAVGLSIATKSLFNINNLNSSFFSLYDRTKYKNEVFNDDLENFTYSFNDAAIVHNVFTEIRADVATELFANDQYRLTGGIALKRNIGIYYSSLRAKDLNLLFRQNPENEELDIHTEGDFEYSYYNTQDNANGFDFFPFSSNAGGWATDLGFELEFLIPEEKTTNNDSKSNTTIQTDLTDTAKPADFNIIKLYRDLRTNDLEDCKKNYFAKLSFYLNNIGYVNYRDQSMIRSVKINAGEEHVISNWSNAFSNIGSQDSFYQYLLAQSINPNEDISNQSILLPMTATLAADLKIPSGIFPLNRSYIQVGYSQNLASFFDDVTNFHFSHSFIVPRYESRNFDISFPLTLYTSPTPQLPLIKFGIGARYKYFYISTESFGTIFSQPTSQLLSFSIGAKFSLFNDCFQPDDTTKIANLLDTLIAKDTKDTDMDGVLDNVDQCIDIPGDASNFGCPIVSYTDLVAKRLSNSLSRQLGFIYGYSTPIELENFGKYADSINNFLLYNPQYNILVSAYGDDTMTIPQQKVMLAQDRADELSKELVRLGMRRQKIKNSIGLGFLQPHGIVNPVRIFRYQYDEDLDGISDSSDRCPTLAGTVSNDGCPLYSSDKQNILNDLAQNIVFVDSTKYLSPKGMSAMKQVVQFMNNNPSMSISMYGPTDLKIGDISAKDELSNERAKVLQDFLVNNNISPARIRSIGIGYLQPPNTYSVLNEYSSTSDKDKDGVLDYEDKCPTIFGSRSNYGCPVISKKIATSLEKISKNINFITGKENFSSNSKKYLRELNYLLKEEPNLSIIANESSNAPFLNESKNSKLAQLRSDNVKQRQTSDGINSERIVSNGLSPLESANSIQSIRVLDKISDMDLDGILDYQDKCPTIPGSPRKEGCPITGGAGNNWVDIEEFNKKFYFSENSDEVPKESLEVAEKFSNYLKENPHIKIVAYGILNNPYTSPSSRSFISQKRARKLDEILRNNRVPSNQFYTLDVDPSEDVANIPVANRIGINEDPDGDGINIKFDKCPNSYGVPEYSGCPQGSYISNDYPKMTPTEEFNLINTNLSFYKNSSTLTQDGLAKYEKIVKHIKDNPNEQFIVYGKYDQSQVQPIERERLAEKRASFLKQDLINRGVNEPQVHVVGLGSQQPLSPINSVQSIRNNNVDTDRDGVLDIYDKCPTLQGTRELNGCPSSSVEQQTFSSIAKNIYFRINSNSLDPYSFSVLNGLIQYLKTQTNILSDKSVKFFIYGRTDNTGSNSYNKRLSASRAKTIYNYLKNRGIPSGQMFAIGLGEDRPIASNATYEGRKQNRTVDFDIKRF